MRRVPIILALMVGWFVGSSYWYVCKIQYLCDTKATTVSAVAENKDTITIDGNTFSKLVTVNFLPDSATPVESSASQKELDEVVAYAKNHPKIEISIKGYTANIPNAINDTDLSKDRADELRQRLQALGVSNPISVTPKGVSDQIGDGSSEEVIAQNRRATIQFNE